MFTQFGKLLRKIRIDRGMLLKDMAAGLDVSSAYLSAIETGRKAVTDDVVARVAEYLGYPTQSDEYQELYDAAQITKGEVSISTIGASPLKQQAALAFARQFNELEGEDMEKILSLLKAAKKPRG
ncbi:helix-turn-helix transcriptional regulator [Pseudomonas corrugata]|uniref:helix-turn-helix domain-containing protein n=1 Tax=Pseudomonas corrugata TaxID=47879 RepID=UPI0028C3D3E6|nr:helix-turn-helix transcriptional regulator [Pseudomonas corrugata]MDU9034242.1 helix-turn-helix transcriptional regulator [Pseudomonas corrugata]